MMLEYAYQVATVIIALGTLAAFLKFVGPWIKRKRVNWWKKSRDRTEFTLGYKTKSGQSEIHSAGYTVGYLFISYKTNHRRRFIHWKYEFLDSFYKKIGKSRRFEDTADIGWMNNFTKFNKERCDTGDGRASYIYQETKVLAFYPIKEFDRTPDWANLPYIGQQIRTYFKYYESQKQNQYNIRNGDKWLKYEELAEKEWLGIARVNVNHYQEPLMPESKKIKRVLKKGFKKQFIEYRIEDTICIRRKTS